MAHSFARVLVHAVFSTKLRKAMIDRQIRPGLHAYLEHLGRKKKSFIYQVGGTDDHVHMLFSLPREQTLSQMMNHLKTYSTLWMKKQGDEYKDFAWQGGYGAFSVSQPNLEQVISYIRNQEAIHSKRSFDSEMDLMIERSGLKHTVGINPHS